LNLVCLKTMKLTQQLSAALLFSLAVALPASAQSAAQAQNLVGGAALGSNAASMDQGGVNALAMPAGGSSFNPNLPKGAPGQPSGLSRQLNANDTTGLNNSQGMRQQPLPPLNKTEFQLFVEESTGQRLSLYGYNLFDNPNFTPLQNVPVPADYVVGPGDEVLLRVWGAIDSDLRLLVDRNGQVSIPKVGTFTVAGLKSQDLEPTFKAQVGKVYNNFQLTVSLGQLRSLQVFVVGQARRPGAYTLSSLSTLVSALFESGGPSATGSMRHIQLKRDNKTIANLDLYQFIHEGSTEADVRLLPGDVIVIPPAGPRAAVLGALDQPAVYELASADEPLGKLLSYGAGISSVTNTRRVLIESLQANNKTDAAAPRSVKEVALDATGLQSQVRGGDVVTLLKLRSEFANAVTLRGNVAQPLRSPFIPGMHVSDLIPDAQALIDPNYFKLHNAVVQFEKSKVDADTIFDEIKSQFSELNWDYAVVERLNKSELTPSLIPFNLRDAVVNHKPEANLALQPGDVVTVFGVKDIPVSLSKRTQFVRLGGEVNAPGVYQLQPGETLTHLVARAGGLSPTAYVYGTLFSRESTRKQQRVNLDQAIRRFEAEMGSMAAAAAQNAGSDADKTAALQANSEQQKATLARLRTLEPNGRIALEINPLEPKLPDLALEDGDSITVPARSDFVSVFGAVLGENSLIARPGTSARDYLRRAGLTRFAEEGAVMIIRADGSVQSTELSDSWFSTDKTVLGMAVYPGDSLYVPEKVDKRTGYVQFMQGAKDISQILANFGLSLAAMKAVGL
jgi:protein involved in polysaccharide export with SLBB domain